MSKLTSRQKAFCREFMIDGNATKAAERAGYSPKTAKFQASRLLTFVNVQENLFKLQEEARESAEVSRNEILSYLAGIIRAKRSDYMSLSGFADKEIKFRDFIHSKLAAIERVSKILGFDSPQTFDINLDKLDEESLDKLINRITNKTNEHKD